MNDLPNHIQITNIDKIVECCFNPEGTLLAFLYIDGSVKIFEMDENRKYHFIAETQPCFRRATSISFAPGENGAIFAISDETGRTHVFQRIKLNEFKQATFFHNHKAPINAIVFAPIGLCLAAASSDGQVSITSCEQQNWTVLHVKVSDNPVTSISWSSPQFMSFIESPTRSSNLKFVTGSANGFFAVFYLKGITWVQEGNAVAAHEGAVNSVAWRPSMGFTRYEIASCGADHLVKLWTFVDNAWSFLEICKTEEEPVSLKWSPCGFILSISSGTNTVIMYREVVHGVWKILEA